MKNRHINTAISSIIVENLKWPKEMNAVSAKVVL
jgi:hypothetical protein